MRRRSLYAIFALATFAAGIVAHLFVNGAANALINDAEKLSDLAHATILWKEPKLVPPYVHSCGHFVITVNSDRKLYLNWTEHGSLDDPSELVWVLTQAFSVRTEMHVYKPGVEATSDLPEDQRIEKSVYIKAAHDLPYGEVTDLIQRLKDAGANPIGLVIESNNNPY
jgi:biopolymer transport protein ExbD